MRNRKYSPETKIRLVSMSVSCTEAKNNKTLSHFKSLYGENVTTFGEAEAALRHETNNVNFKDKPLPQRNYGFLKYLVDSQFLELA